MKLVTLLTYETIGLSNYIKFRIRIFEWLETNGLSKDDYRMTSTNMIIFDNDEDAIAFKIAFGL